MYALWEHPPLVQQHTSNAKRPVDQEEAQQKTKQRKNQKKQKVWDDDTPCGAGRLLGAGSSGAGGAGDAWASLAGFEISLCGPHATPALRYMVHLPAAMLQTQWHHTVCQSVCGVCITQDDMTQQTSTSDSCLMVCSPEDAYEVFQRHKVSEAQFAEQGPLLVSKAGLMCRLGDRLYPWQEAAPVVMGVLAFGGDWQHFLPAEGGLPVAVPSVEAHHPQQDARKVSQSYSSFSYKKNAFVEPVKNVEGSC